MQAQKLRELFSCNNCRGDQVKCRMMSCPDLINPRWCDVCCMLYCKVHLQEMGPEFVCTKCGLAACYSCKNLTFPLETLKRWRTIKDEYPPIDGCVRLFECKNCAAKK